ncbi:AA_kinase domain-containing protein/Myb_DNA-bind_4 domain-containing protein [Cephalotus follicularis]|uniref:UMP kinase n=1 Tax=Cephalotus follicularis TaxID=3775 RepID=A0A1Q3B7I9_CEPFO|nr:AA_kinase domain-containing protein/Myb_DNA-bind_4 domain-containing protein [Cephalotus follicularis]
MASCDDDFSLLSDDQTTTTTNPHHHHLYAPHRFTSKSTPIHAPPPIPQDLGDGRETEDEETDSAFHGVNPFSAENSEPRIIDVRAEKRKDREEISDGGGGGDNSFNFNHNNKKSRSSCSEYRKDREEWSDAAIGCLLEAYLEKFTQLNRGNLRGRDWEEVAALVSERCEKQSKSVEQCKNKVDNLKKRYKLERHRMINGGVSASHWPWFKKMEEIVGNSLPVKSASEEDKSFPSSPISVRQSKRYSTTSSSPVGQTTNMKIKSVSNPKWRRVVFKISGVALAGTGPNNIDPKVAMLIAREVSIACRLGIQVAIVVGGRNFFCGDTWVTATGSDRCTAYQIGDFEIFTRMMASVMNSILLQSALEKMDVQTRVQTAFAMQEVAEPYSRQRAIRHLEKGRVVIFGGIGAGTGNPLFSTDTAAALRASEINAEAVLKGTNVDGVYDCHSRDNNVTFEHISFRELVSRGAASMDMMALTFCEENSIPVVVFNLLEPGNISKALCGEQVGTLIDQTGRLN